MKKRKIFRLLWAVFAAMMLLPLGAAARMQDEIEESVPYGIFDEVTGTVTFYFGEPTKDAVLVKEEREDYKPLVADVVENYLDEVKKVVFDKSFHIFKPTTMAHWFRACKYAIEGLENINTEDVTDMSQMFIWYYVDKSVYSILDLSSWDTRKVTNMEQMFYSCAPVQIIYVGDKWSTESVTNGKDMFKSMPILVGGQGTTLRDIENLVRQETDDNKYVRYARIDEGLDAPGLFARKGENINAKFEVYADKKKFVLGESLDGHIGVDITNYNLTMMRAWLDELAPNNDLQPVVSGFDNTKLGKQTITINCYNTTTTLEVNVVEPEPYAVFADGTLTFYYDGNKANFDGAYGMRTTYDDEWSEVASDITKVVFDKSFADYYPTSCVCWFLLCHNLTEIQGMKEYLNTENVTNMSGMFSGLFTTLDLSNFNTEKVTRMDYMFANCANLTTLDLSYLSTKNVTNMDYMFLQSGKLKTIFVGDNWTTSAVTSSKDMFKSCKSIYGGEGTIYDENHRTAEYAIIDGGAEHPGYFTRKGEEKNTITSIEISKLPKTNYNKGDDLDLSDGELTVNYSDGTSETISITKAVFASVSGYDPNSVGAQTLTLSYNGLEKTFDVTVSEQGERCIIVESAYKQSEVWDNQFWVYFPNYTMSPGDHWEWSMEARANQEATIPTQIHENPGSYLSDGGFGDIALTTQWEKFEGSYDCTEKDEGGKAVAFHLSALADANLYYFRNISVKVNGKEVVSNGDLSSDDFSSFYWKKDCVDPNLVTTDNVKNEIWPISISVSTLPDKTTYYLDYPLELEGGVITVTYSDQSTSTINMNYRMEDVIVTGFDNTTIGKKTLKVSYLGLETTFDVSVQEDTRGVVSIKPNDTRYPYGASPNNPSAVEYYATVTFEDGSYGNYDLFGTNLDVKGLDIFQLGKQDVTITYRGFTWSGQIEIYTNNLYGRYIKIESTDREGVEGANDWDNQFFVSFDPLCVYEGDVLEWRMEVKADKDATIPTQMHSYPGTYHSDGGFGSEFPFTTEWKTVSGVYECSGNEGALSVAFNLSAFRPANTYYFRNIFVKINGRQIIRNGDLGDNNFGCFYYQTNGSGVQEVTTENVESCLDEPVTYATFDEPTGTVTLSYGTTLPYNAVIFNPDRSESQTSILSDVNIRRYDIDITKIIISPSFANYKPTSTAYWFYDLWNLQEIEGLKYLNTDDVTNMALMFEGCVAIESLDLSHFNTKEVTKMTNMFENCHKLKSLDLSSFNTSKVTEMSSMWFNCPALEAIYVSYDWVTPPNQVVMFGICTNLTGGEGTKFSSDYYDNPSIYARIDGGPDNPGLFTKSPKETRTPVSIEIATPPTQLVYAKDEALNLDEKARLTVKFDDGSEIHPWIANSKVTGYDPTVIGEQTVTVEYLGLTTTFEVRVEDKPKEAYAAITRTNDDIILEFFYNGNKSAFGEVYEIPTYNPDNVESRPKWWSQTVTFDITKVVFNKSFAAYRPTGTAYWFEDFTKLQEIEGLQYLNTEEVVDMNRMFYNCLSLIALDVSHFNTAKVTNMGDMFCQCMALTNLDVSNFNTSNVTSMRGMFFKNVMESIDLSSFNTMNVEDMNAMFFGCENLKTIYVSYDFITPYEGAYSIFQNCDNLIGGEGTKWSNDYVVGYTYARIDGGPDYPGLFTKSPKETRTPVSIEIATPPAQLVYAKDEALNLDEKARLTVKFDDGSEIHPWIANSKVTGYDPTVIGEQTVTVEYLGLTTTFEVRVISNGVIVEPDDANTETVADLYDNTLTTLVEAETEVDKVVVHREFKENSASTIVLPLDKEVADAAHGVTNMDGYEFYEFAGVAKNDKGKWEATYKQVETIEANKPYIVVNKEGNDLVFDNGNEQIDLKPVGKDETTITEGTDGTSAEGWQFVGTYEKKVWNADSPNEFGFAANDEGDDIKAGDFVRIGAGASIKPMRAYLRYTKDDNPFSKAGEQLPDKIGVVLIPLGSVVNPDDPNNDPNNGDIETPVSEIVPATNNDAKVWSYDKTIVIEAAPSTAYQVIDLGGRTLKNGVTNSSREEIVLGGKTDGMVIVRIDGKSFKIKY